MDENTINIIGKKFLTCYKGVYSINEIPQSTNYPSAYVVHIANANSKIGHWVALIEYRAKIILFDPAGSYAVRNKKFQLYIERKEKLLVTNFSPVQPKSSFLCGVYCLTFLHHMLVRRKTFHSYISSFRNEKNSDSYICDKFMRYYKIKCANVIRKNL